MGGPCLSGAALPAYIHASRAASAGRVSSLQFEILIRLAISAVSDFPGPQFHEGFVHGRRGHSSSSELGNGRLWCCCC